MSCPECGHENQEGDRYCANCGTQLQPATDLPPQFTPQPREQAYPAPPTISESRSTPEPESPPDKPSDPEWRMSPPPPEDPPKRRVWLWVLAGIMLFCVLLICGLGVFLTTGTGQDLLDDLGTRAASVATGTP